MLIKGDGISNNAPTKKKTTTVATPTSILGNTALGKQAAANTAKSLGVAAPKTLSIAASDAAKAKASTDPAYAAQNAELKAQAALSAANKVAAPTAKTNMSVPSNPAYIAPKKPAAPTLMEAAFANAKANANITPMTPPSVSTPVTPQAAAANNAAYSSRSADLQKASNIYTPTLDPMKNALTNPAALTYSQSAAPKPSSYTQAQAAQITDPRQYMADQNEQMQWDTHNSLNGKMPASAPAISGGSGGGSSGSSSGGSSLSGTSNVVVPQEPTFTYDDAPSSSSDQTGNSGSDTFTLPTKEENPYIADLINSRFEYNPATDQGYLQACAAAENSIIQSIIGRGGMYSSVAQSAVATKLSDLAIEYEKAAYDRYTSERTYKMQLAQFEQDRIDTAYDEAFAAMKYQNDYAQQQYENYINSEQQKFENQLNLAQFQFTLDKETFDQNQTIAAANLAAQKSYSSSQASSAKAATATQDADVQTQLYNLQVQKSKFNQYKTQWANSGRASKEVASYFSAYGVSVGASISDFTDVVNGVENSINNQIYSLSQQAIEIGEGKFASQFMDDYTKPATAIQSGTSADTSTSAQTNFYYQTLNQLTGSKVTAKQTAQLIKDLTTNSKYSAYQTKMGSYYFGKLLDALNAQKIALQKSSSSSSVFS